MIYILLCILIICLLNQNYKLVKQALQHLIQVAEGKLDLTKECLIEIITNWFAELERKQFAEQLKEVDKKGLWEADVKSVTFEEVANGLANAILLKIKEKQWKSGNI